MDYFTGIIERAPRNRRGGIDWQNMSQDSVAEVFAAAVAIGDKRTERNASRAGFRLALAEVRSGRRPVSA